MKVYTESDKEELIKNLQYLKRWYSMPHDHAQVIDEVITVITTSLITSHKTLDDVDAKGDWTISKIKEILNQKYGYLEKLEPEQELWEGTDCVVSAPKGYFTDSRKVCNKKEAINNE